MKRGRSHRRRRLATSFGSRGDRLRALASQGSIRRESHTLRPHHRRRLHRQSPLAPRRTGAGHRIGIPPRRPPLRRKARREKTCLRADHLTDLTTKTAARLRGESQPYRGWPTSYVYGRRAGTPILAADRKSRIRRARFIVAEKVQYTLHAAPLSGETL